jgi:hypothetical protein
MDRSVQVCNCRAATIMRDSTTRGELDGARSGVRGEVITVAESEDVAGVADQECSSHRTETATPSL